MAKISTSLFLMSKRAYSVAAENIKVRSIAPTIRKAVGEASEPEGNNTSAIEVFWMRDPSTGNWVPENHFGEVDAADLRSKLISKKPTTSSSPSN